MKRKGQKQFAAMFLSAAMLLMQIPFAAVAGTLPAAPASNPGHALNVMTPSNAVVTPSNSNYRSGGTARTVSDTYTDHGVVYHFSYLESGIGVRIDGLELPQNSSSAVLTIPDMVVTFDGSTASFTHVTEIGPEVLSTESTYTDPAGWERITEINLPGMVRTIDDRNFVGLPNVQELSLSRKAGSPLRAPQTTLPSTVFPVQKRKNLPRNTSIRSRLCPAPMDRGNTSPLRTRPPISSKTGS